MATQVQVWVKVDDGNVLIGVGMKQAAAVGKGGFVAATDDQGFAACTVQGLHCLGKLVLTRFQIFARIADVAHVYQGISAGLAGHIGQGFAQYGRCICGANTP